MNNKSNGGKIGSKNIKRKLVDEIWRPWLTKKYFYIVSVKHGGT